MNHYMHCCILNKEALVFMVSEDFFKVILHYTVKGHDLCKGTPNIAMYCRIFYPEIQS